VDDATNNSAHNCHVFSASGGSPLYNIIPLVVVVVTAAAAAAAAAVVVVVNEGYVILSPTELIISLLLTLADR
jgi:hypothetical protein